MVAEISFGISFEIDKLQSVHLEHLFLQNRIALVRQNGWIFIYTAYENELRIVITNLAPFRSFLPQSIQEIPT